MSITTAPAEMMYTPQEVVAREIRGILAKAGVKTQGEVAQILGVARSGAAARLNGKQEFTIGELITLAGALNMSLSELLGDSIVNTKVPAPSYIEEKGKKKSPRSALYRTERRTRFFLVKSAPCGARTHDLRIKSP